MKSRLCMISVMLITCVSLTFAGGRSQGSGSAGKTAEGYKPINDGKPITLLVDFHERFTPTLNTVQTAENPKVILVPQRIADNFMKIHPNVKIEWVRTKPLSNPEQASEWFVTQIAAGTAPAIAYTWNIYWPERDWYYDLTGILNTPNEYVPGNTRWKDLFADYIWTKANMTDARGRIVNIPSNLQPGPNIGMYYNKEIFAKLNLKVPHSWAELREACLALKAAGYAPMAPWSGSPTISTDTWVFYDSIGPAYAGYLFDRTDYNKDGRVVLEEQIRAAKNNVYNPVQQEYAREMLQILKDMFNNMFVSGWESVDIPALWNSGKVGIRWNGTWELASEASNTQRGFEYDIFPFPTITTATSKYVKNVEYTKSGPYQPDGHGFNLLKPIVENNKGLLEAAVAFMKYFTVPENLNAAILEDGTQLPPLKDAVIPPLLEEWFKNPFPIFPNVPYMTSWPTGFTTESHLLLSKELESWVKGQTGDAEFFRRWNEVQQKGADDLIAALGINTSGW